MLSATLVIGSTNVLELTGLQDTTTGLYPVDATVTAQLQQPNGDPVTGATAVTLAYVSPTTGATTRYRGVIPSTVALSPKVYTLTVTASDTSGNVRLFVVSATAQQG